MELVLMTAEQAARYLGVKVPTLYAYVSRGLIESVPHGEDPRRRTYRKRDLDRLRRRSAAHGGHGAAAADALEWGAPSLQTVLCRITPEGPAYRGRLAAALVADGVPYESVAELLWTGDLPPARPHWLDGSPGVVELSPFLPPDAPALDVLRTAVLLGGLSNRARFGSSGEAQLSVARQLVAGTVESLSAHRGRSAGTRGGITGTLAAAFGITLAPKTERALEAALVVIADHELNASTFSSRVAASTGADLYACVGAALSTFTGPLHGGACERCVALLSEVARAGSARPVLEARLRRGESLPGFGHRLYPEGDPRFPLLVRIATTAGGAERIGVADELRAAAEELALGAPTSDMGLVLLARALGLPDEAAVTMFAVGRMAGWIAHAFEQRRQGFMLRPRARYVGV